MTEKEIDDYVNAIKERAGKHWPAYKPNKDLSKVADPNFRSSKEGNDLKREYRNRPVWNNANNEYGNYLGFDYDEDWIRANDPTAYKDYKWNDYIGADLKQSGAADDFISFMKEHPQYTHSEVLNAWLDKFKKINGNDYPVEELNKFNDRYNSLMTDEYGEKDQNMSWDDRINQKKLYEEINDDFINETAGLTKIDDIFKWLSENPDYIDNYTDSWVTEHPSTNSGIRSNSSKQLIPYLASKYKLDVDKDGDILGGEDFGNINDIMRKEVDEWKKANSTKKEPGYKDFLLL